MKTYIDKISCTVAISVAGVLPTICAVSCENSDKNIIDQRPNIILFVSDDHGKDALGCYGNDIIKTPNLDALAESGVLFNHAYCTSASSAASRSVLLTGQYGHAIGAYGHVHDYHHFSTYDTIRTLPMILSQAGYHTARIGKYHVAPESVYHFDQLFEADPRNTVEMANNCKEVFNSEKPFFLYFCPDDPHRGEPFTPPVWDMPNRFGNLDEGYAGVETVKYKVEDVIVPEFLPDTKECREEIAEYYQSISRIDQGFGKLMQHLKAAGKLDNTIIIYISDNGMAFAGAKTTLYEPGIELPCIIKSPFVKQKGMVNNAMISWVDMTPTILDMAGVEYDSTRFQGRSFNDIIDQEHPQGRDEIYASHTFHEITMYYPMRSCHERQYKLIWNVAWEMEYPFASDLWASSSWQSIYRNNIASYGKRTTEALLRHAEFELYDLENDPYEIDNLASNPKYATELERLKEKLKKWQRETKDPWFIMWDHDMSLQSSGVNL
ncbi:MAG: sulfatase [Rikenellaceae bacterium]